MKTITIILFIFLFLLTSCGKITNENISDKLNYIQNKYKNQKNIDKYEYCKDYKDIIIYFTEQETNKKIINVSYSPKVNSCIFSRVQINDGYISRGIEDYFIEYNYKTGEGKKERFLFNESCFTNLKPEKCKIIKEEQEIKISELLIEPETGLEGHETEIIYDL